MKKKLESPFFSRGARVDMMSLMDVMFLVLVFFVYAVFDMSVHRGMHVDLPSAAGSLARGEKIIVTIGPRDTLELNGRARTRDELVREVKRLIAVRPDLPVLISGDRQASLGSAIELLGELKAAGVEKARFQVSGKARGGE